MIVNINGVAADITQVRYPERLTYSRSGENLLRLQLYSGAHIDIDYGWAESARDRDFDKVIQAINILKYG